MMGHQGGGGTIAHRAGAADPGVPELQPWLQKKSRAEAPSWLS